MKKSFKKRFGIRFFGYKKYYLELRFSFMCFFNFFVLQFYKQFYFAFCVYLFVRYEEQIRVISFRRRWEDILVGFAGLAVRFFIRLGRGDFDFGVGQAGVGDCCSCLELWRQRDVMSGQFGFFFIVIFRFFQRGQLQFRKQIQGFQGVS